MNIIIWLSVGVILGYFGYKVTYGNKGGSSSSAKATEDEKNIREVKEDRKGEILEMLAMAEEGRITNDDVEKALDVSDASATNYLTELEKEGKIKQIGETGRSVYYTKQ